MTPEQLKTAELLLAAFRGREDHVAVGNADGSFRPVKLRSPMQPSWMARHLGGQECLGFYLMNEESQVWCSCVDFDNKPDHPDTEWKNKTAALALWLQQAGLSPLVELSQSGSGAHIWLFFEEPTAAWVPRAWWQRVSTKLAIPFREVYPRQDELTGKGIGNLVRYPLWKHSRFVDTESDWLDLDADSALEQIRRTSAAELRNLAFELGFGDLRPASRIPVVSLLPTDNGDGEELPARVRSRLERKGTLLTRRWNGDTTGLRDPSRSGLAQSIACELVRQYLPTAEVTAALRYWCRENGVEKGERPDWIPRTVHKAYEYCALRTEERSVGSVRMQDACHAYIDTLERNEVMHVGSGVPDLDQSVDGVGYGEMAVIAARPGHGKSVFACQWLDYAAGLGIPGLIISEEMAAIELGKRSLAGITALDQEYWDQEAIPTLRADVNRHFDGRAPVLIVENCNSIDRVEDVIDQYAGMDKVKLVAVDYLQLLGSRAARRYDEVSEVSRRLKQVARRNGCALIALCQLNREIDKRIGNEPRLSDLRESGQVEQDADLILFLQWLYRLDEQNPKDAFRIYVGKRRNGPIRKAVINTTFNAGRQRIGPLRNREPGQDEERD